MVALSLAMRMSSGMIGVIQLSENSITTWSILTETCQLLLTHMGVHAQVKFTQQDSQFAELFEFEASHLESFAMVMKKCAISTMDLIDGQASVLSKICFLPKKIDL
jgi:hypothetical protein